MIDWLIDWIVLYALLVIDCGTWRLVWVAHASNTLLILKCHKFYLQNVLILFVITQSINLWTSIYSKASCVSRQWKYTRSIGLDTFYRSTKGIFGSFILEIFTETNKLFDLKDDIWYGWVIDVCLYVWQCRIWWLHQLLQSPRIPYISIFITQWDRSDTHIMLPWIGKSCWGTWNLITYIHVYCFRGHWLWR